MNKKEYDRQRYINKIKPLIFGERQCKVCEIMLKSNRGAHYSRTYCRECIDKGLARKDSQRRSYLKNRKKRLIYAKANHVPRPEYQKAYARKRQIKKVLQLQKGNEEQRYATM